MADEEQQLLAKQYDNEVEMYKAAVKELLWFKKKLLNTSQITQNSNSILDFIITKSFPFNKKYHKRLSVM